jgi:hypothetical protein
MAWSRNAARRSVLSGAASLLLGGLLNAAEADPDVDKWFARHTEALWRPLAEKMAGAKAGMTSPVENLALPLDYHANGRIKAVLRAARSQIVSDGMIYAETVSVEMLTDEGLQDGRLQAEACLFDRENKQGYCEGVVSVLKGTDRLKGRGMYFSIEAQFIKILSECEIRTQRIPVKVGRLS